MGSSITYTQFPFASTFSIVAFDPDSGDLGVAVASKWFAVGSAIPWAKARVGAVATQAWMNTSFGPKGLNLLSDGLLPKDVLEMLLEADPEPQKRQVGIVNSAGSAAAHTGDACPDWAGQIVGKNFAAQGNTLTGPDVVAEMAETINRAQGELADRLLAALIAGQEAGGDRRGRQSASLLVVREGAGRGYGTKDDRYLDLRVDDHPSPVKELNRIFDVRLNR